MRHTIEAALDLTNIHLVMVTTDDPLFVSHCKKCGGNVKTELRPSELPHCRIVLSQGVTNAIEYPETEHGIHTDIVSILSVHSPLRATHHIQKAIDNLLLYNASSIISVSEDYGTLHRHDELGLEPLNHGMENQIRLEGEALFVDNGAVKVMWRDVVSNDNISGRRGWAYAHASLGKLAG